MKLRPNTFMCVGVIIITTQRFLYIQRIYAILKCVNHKLTSTTHLCKQNMYVVADIKVPRSNKLINPNL